MQKIKDFILDTDFTYKYFNNIIYISNFDEILIFDTSNVTLKVKDKCLKVKGKNLTINKLLSKEILIKGIIENVQYK